MKVNRSACKQYLSAMFVATVLVASQARDVLSQVDDGMANAKQLAMLIQIRQAVLEDVQAIGIVSLYLGVFVAAHLILTLGAVALFRGAARQLASPRLERLPWALGFVLAVVTCAVLWNRRLYPQSMVFPNSDLLLLQALSPLLFWGLTGLVLGAVALAMIRAARIRPKSTLAMGAVAACAFLPSCVRADLPSRQLADPRPDVIVIGVDSLRPDFLARNGFPSSALAPHINGALGDMVSFKDTLTPMARTFVAYMSILTGKDPLHHGARFNLYPRDRFDRRDTVAWKFGSAGYHTIFAMDEARFANVDKSFGFDQVVTPPPGVLDFAIGSAFDSVGTNLLLEIPAFRRHLGYIYGNRAAYRVYRAQDHSARLRSAIAGAPADEPLLLFSHFCLPHWPYLPRDPYDLDAMPKLSLQGGEYSDAPDDYLRAVYTADSQVGALLDELRAAGRLRNAIVVLLSDHGEGLGMARDEFDLVEEGRLEGPLSLAAAQYGHGGYALAEGQYRVVLAMQHYVQGKPAWKARDIAGPASLLDVAPTLLGAAGVEVGSPKAGGDGTSLLPALMGEVQSLPERVRFVESGERAASVERADIDEKQVAAEMYYLYALTPDLRFEIDQSLLERVLAEKQRGAWLGERGVVAKPAGYVGDAVAACWQGMDFRARSMSCIPYPSVDPQYRRLQEEVCAHYAHDGDFAERWCGAGRNGVAVGGR